MSADARVKFGIHLGSYFPLGFPAAEQFLEIGRLTEELGFDSLWVGDHLFWSSPVLEALTLLSAYAATTRRVKLGTGILLVPLRQPVWLAKSLAMLDYMSGGRLIVGVGIGGENPREVEASGIRMTERGKRVDEALALMKRLWTEDDVTHRGAFYTCAGVTIEPKPIQRPGPPILIGGRSEAALRRAARFGDGWMGYVHGPSGFAACIDKVREYRRSLGKDDSGMMFVQGFYTFLDDDGARAREQGMRFLVDSYGPDHAAFFAERSLMGTPAECREKLLPFIRAGANHLTFMISSCPPEDMLVQVRRIWEDVVVPLRGLLG
ncbi:MAG: LLM class flavin-dependent oxidoreductase [Clostridia bacterium]|nr:LLM class flavin-dependent oxidoreductase [Clostridia bacterium]